MDRRPPVPEIPPTQAVQRTQSEQPALPDLLEAFWGDGGQANPELPADEPGSAADGRQRRRSAAARTTQRSKARSAV